MSEGQPGSLGAWVRRVGGRQVPAFVGGFAVMGAEMAFARQVAPWFGSSLPVWAVLISVLLLALAVGAWWGGRLSLRARPRQLSARLLIVAGAGLLAAAWLLPVLLALAARARELGVVVAVAAGLAALAIAGLPLLVLGALPPALVAAWVADEAPAGLASGRLSAAATAGSLVGTLGAAFVALPWLGTRATGLALGAMCLACGLLGAGADRRARIAAGLLLPLALLGGQRSGPVPLGSPGRIREARETPYQSAFVLEAGNGTRSLRLNSLKEWHSHYDPRGPTLSGVWPYFLLAQALRPGCQAPPARVLVLGLGAGTLARDLGFAFPGAKARGVEIDPVVVELGRRWFGLSDTIEVDVEDARGFLNRPAAEDQRYDLVFVDAFSGAYLPFQLATRESFARVAAHLAPGGAVAVNVLWFPEDPALARAVAHTMATVFDHVTMTTARPGYNGMLIGWQGHAQGDSGTGTATGCAEPAHPEQRAFVRRTLPEVQRLPAASVGDAPVMTDDRAPVEWLTHRMAWAALRAPAKPRPARRAP